MFALLKGSIFDTECDMLIIPCNTFGGISSIVSKGLKTDELPFLNTIIPYGDVSFQKAKKGDHSIVIGFAASVKLLEIGFSENYNDKINCITKIMQTVFKYAKRYSLNRINAPLLATGAGNLPSVLSFHAMIKPFINNNNIELFVYTLYSEIYDKIKSYRGEEYVMSNDKKPLVFISYSRKDKEKVSLFASHLVQNNYDVWIDAKDISLGDSIISEVAEGLSKADIYILFISNNSLNSKWVTEELSIAQTMNVDGNKPFIIPVLLENCGIPLSLTGRRYLDASVSIQRALQQFNDEFTNNNNVIKMSNTPILTGVRFGLSKNTTIAVGGIANSFTMNDLIRERENIQKDLRKKAHGILMNFVPLSDFDLQSAIPKYKNGMYSEQVETISGPFDSSICEKVIAQAIVYNPEYKRISELVQGKLDKLNTTSLTYEFSIPYNESGFDKKCIQKIQDTYMIISYDFDDGAMIEYESNFFISIKHTLEQILIKINAAYDFTFSEKAAKFSPQEFVKWLIE